MKFCIVLLRNKNSINFFNGNELGYYFVCICLHLSRFQNGKIIFIITEGKNKNIINEYGIIQYNFYTFAMNDFLQVKHYSIIHV